MESVKILDKEFAIYLSEEEIQKKIKVLSEQINTEYEGEEPIFLGILNGSFMFASDLYKNITLRSKISFLKLASYQGTQSQGEAKQLIGLNEDIKDKIVFIIEDIVDTGNTLESIIQQLSVHNPKAIKLISLLFKPQSYKKKIPIDYYCFSIDNDFIIGYGLDYNGYGRNLKQVYKIIK